MKVYNAFSDPLTVTRCVPQVILLGRILLLLYVNNIFNISEFKENLTSLADDKVITFVGKSWEDVLCQDKEGIKLI